jgi:hypothetical protein
LRFDNALLARIDADVARQGKVSRQAWLTDLAAAVLDGRLVPGRPAPARGVRPHPKPVGRK